ncbi:hypothetical protein CIC12_10685 [Burkholderia sp. SG-MS1]|uniref:protein kinase domain-containing protein n=1 Tax=Paraburkholderia sp. SG-MS1 TaxID=2023741 RepID=UPI0014468271|nr:protein kinase [Paraburkholderia sp. SG-MS1]NKJ47200.1 hypothetical protein [Paraburkholderia sp. SG-MS1]
MNATHEAANNKKPRGKREVEDERGSRYLLIDSLSEGGQGLVCLTDTPGVLVKVSRLPISDARSARWFQQVQRVKRLPLDGLKVARPQAMIVSPRHGYVMELMDGLEPLQRLLDAPLQSGMPGFLESGGLSRRLRLLAGLAGTLAELHGRGLAYGDLSPANVFVSRSIEHSEVWLIDCDNISALSKTSVDSIYTPGYGAPEVVRGVSGIDSVTDAWSFAVIAYQLLRMQHPLKGDQVNDGDEDEEQRALRGELPWIDDSVDESNRASSGIPRDSVISKRLGELFQQCFDSGRTAPLERPSMQQWRAALDFALHMLVQCDDCGSMFYFNRNLQCSFCDHKEVPERHLLLRHCLRAPELKDEPGIGDDNLLRTGFHQILNHTTVQLRTSPPGTFSYALSDLWCTLLLTDDGLCIDPVRGMNTFLQAGAGATLRRLKRREVIPFTNRNEQYFLCLGEEERCHVWQFQW